MFVLALLNENRRFDAAVIGKESLFVEKQRQEKICLLVYTFYHDKEPPLSASM
jgi:hypothetical protein